MLCFIKYNIENKKLNELLSKLKDSEYNENLMKNIKTTKEQIIFYEKKIKTIKSKLQYDENIINHQNKKPNNKLKKITYAYNSKNNEYNAMSKKMEKIEKDNEKRINELKEKKKSLGKNAEDLYGITIIENKRNERKK